MSEVFPQPTGDLRQWGSLLVTTLSLAFSKIEPQLEPGTIVLWPAGKTIPKKYLPCDGTEYLRAVSTPLYKLFGESSPGKFIVPSITGPTGTVAVVRV